MEEKQKGSSAEICSYLYCKDCGWPIVVCCNNDEMINLFPNSDWIIYCANKGCLNHKGEDYNQNSYNPWTKEKK